MKLFRSDKSKLSESPQSKNLKNFSITAPFSVLLFGLLALSLFFCFFAVSALEAQTRSILRGSFSDNYARFLAGQMSRLIGNYPEAEAWEKDGSLLSVELKKRAPVSGLSGILIMNNKDEVLGRIPAESECQPTATQGSAGITVNNQIVGQVKVCLESTASGLSDEALSLLTIGTLTSHVGADYGRLVASQIELMIDEVGDPDYWEYAPGIISYTLSGIMPLKGVTSVSVFNRKGEFVALEYLNDTSGKPVISSQSGLTYKGQGVGQIIVDLDFPEIRNIENSFRRYLLFGITIIVLVLFAFPVAIVRRLEKAAKTTYLELQNSHTELEETQLKLVNSAKMAALGTMAGGIAHEINNPLAIIIGHADILYKLKDTSEINIDNVKVRSKKVLDTAFRIAKIVKSLKSMSRESEGDPFVATSMSSIIDETLEICSERARNFGIKIEISEIPSTAIVECQPVQISQVILNLVNNSCDAIDELSEKWVRIEIKDYDHRIELFVTDSGRGIPKEYQETLFRPFHTTKSAGKGTGLGLSISRQIIESHGGTLNLDTTCEHTRFTIELSKVQNKIVAS